MRERALRGVVLALLVGISCGCGLMARGNKQTVELITDPPGAKVEINRKTHIAPAKVLVQRNKKYEVIVTHPGYQGVRFILAGRWDAGGAGAVAMDAAIPGGSVMFLIDTLAGADREFNKIATIKLPPSTQPTTQLVTLYEFKGHLHASKEEYKAAVARDKELEKQAKEAKKNKKKATTQPTK